ncbi:hypothetical protein [Psychrobacter sp. K31L]|uniref:hypothetical protein n=1 Tax=Psychrobacter sp. K31L TaxID=2820758 RepID=UPI001B3329DB|nr:hypothetical protein [Psychrobacter sp. K31L]MBP3947201.1 hypothetical protein [Psychrobacter sp. K31L]
MYQVPQYEIFSDLDSRNTDGELINNSEAVEILKNKFGFTPQVIFDAIQKADQNFNMKTKVNCASGIARWGDIGENIALQLISNEIEFNRDQGQPTLTILNNNIQIIIMSSNDALGNMNLPISSNCSKGIETKHKIDVNKYRNMTNKKLETWVLYYPSRKHDIYQDDVPNLIYELARPMSYIEMEDGKIFPTDHDCRLMFSSDSEGEVQSYMSEFADDSVNEDSFEIGYKNASNEE